MNGHAVDVCRRNAGRCGDCRLKPSLTQPLHIRIYRVRRAAPRLAREKYIDTGLQNLECGLLLHPSMIAESLFSNKDCPVSMTKRPTGIRPTCPRSSLKSRGESGTGLY